MVTDCSPKVDVILYEYDGAGNRTVRKAIIQGAKEDKQKTITTEELIGRNAFKFPRIC